MTATTLIWSRRGANRKQLLGLRVEVVLVDVDDPDRPDRMLFYSIYYPTLETSSVPGTILGFPLFFLPDLTGADWRARPRVP